MRAYLDAVSAENNNNFGHIFQKDMLFEGRKEGQSMVIKEMFKFWEGEVLEI